MACCATDGPAAGASDIGKGFRRASGSFRGPAVHHKTEILIRHDPKPHAVKKKSTARSSKLVNNQTRALDLEAVRGDVHHD